MSKHTPGPFEAVEGSSFWTVEAADGQRLANTLDSEMIFIGSDEFNHSEANAKLFAAAPDLLESLTNLVGLAKLGAARLDKYHAALADAERLIAKANGDSV